MKIYCEGAGKRAGKAAGEVAVMVTGRNRTTREKKRNGEGRIEIERP